MGIQDRQVHRNAKFAEHTERVGITSAVSQTDAKVDFIVPGVPFEITGVDTYCLTKTGAVTADVKIQTTSALATAAAFTAAARVPAALSTTLANIRGGSTDAINIHYTTDGTGALTHGRVRVTWRPQVASGYFPSKP